MAGPLKSAIMTGFPPVPRPLTGAIFLLFIVACTGSPPELETLRGMSRAKFVVVMRELTFAEPAARPVILKRHGVTEADLRSSVQILSTDPMALSHTLDSIQTGMDRDRFIRPKRFPPGLTD